jgi:hypothetical protein
MALRNRNLSMRLGRPRLAKILIDAGLYCGTFRGAEHSPFPAKGWPAGALLAGPTCH